MPASNNNTIPSTIVAGVRITAASKSTVRARIQERLHARIPTRIVTPYSEFLFRALHDTPFKQTLNAADIALPDGIATAWAATFLAVPITAKSTAHARLQVTWQMVWTGASIILNPSRVTQIIPETIQGSEFVYDLCEIAAQEQAPIFIAGGFGEVPANAARLLQATYPGLEVAGTSNARVDAIDGAAAHALVEEIQRAHPRVLFLALGPYKQELFMMQYWDALGVDLAIGLGGTFNYLTGDVRRPPVWVRKIGLEWLFRLVTQPHRAPRIYQATFGLVWALMRYKLELWTKEH